MASEPDERAAEGSSTGQYALVVLIEDVAHNLDDLAEIFMQARPWDAESSVENKHVELLQLRERLTALRDAAVTEKTPVRLVAAVLSLKNDVDALRAQLLTDPELDILVQAQYELPITTGNYRVSSWSTQPESQPPRDDQPTATDDLFRIHKQLTRQVMADAEAELSDAFADETPDEAIQARKAGRALDDALIDLFLRLGPPPDITGGGSLAPVNSGGGAAE
ncbi:hypothetical protein [Streptomyces salinarius]|uniref:hypothetical protein n=1 Tax=Streptomyces salinarius TaxID=2762598 RepID=UPI0028528556|nr:hypothetical protein [Streptomyces salinarius]